jgi:hypothetical protein
MNYMWLIVWPSSVLLVFSSLYRQPPPLSHAWDPPLCNTSMIMYLQMLSFLREEAARPTPNAPLLTCVQIAHFRLDVERRPEPMNTFMRSAFETISAGS